MQARAVIDHFLSLRHGQADLLQVGFRDHALARGLTTTGDVDNLAWRLVSDASTHNAQMLRRFQPQALT